MSASSSPPLLIAGMHRSGTSLVGSLVQRLGVDLGEQLVPADRNNPRGYQEDAGLVALHGALLSRLVGPAPEGHADWGWDGESLVPEESLRPLAPELRAAVAGRGPGPWGFKDPRTTVALEAWAEALPEARFLLVYRCPWEVAASMQRVGAEAFLRHPEWGAAVWTAYNRRLLAFRRRHRERCLLVSSNALPAALERLEELVRACVPGLTGPALTAELFEPELFRGSGEDAPEAALWSIAQPEASALHAELEAEADLPSGHAAPGGPDALLGTRRPPAPRVSVVVPVHNDGVLLLDALSSFERSATPEDELLLVNDGSSEPRTTEILERLEDAGYAVLHKPQGGLSSARNHGFRAARAPLVLPLDADNRLRPLLLTQGVARMSAEPDLQVVFGDRQLFGAERRRVRVPAFDLGALLGGNTLDACALMRRSLWEELGGYDEAMTGLEDWELWIRAGARGARFGQLLEVAFDYRVRPGSLIDRSLAPAKRRALVGHVLERHEALLHAHLPWWMRPLAALPLAGPAVNRAFWRALWRLIGPGGAFRMQRERQEDQEPARASAG